jgi:uncharacterized FlaG/YvyC family protein
MTNVITSDQVSVANVTNAVGLKREPVVEAHSREINSELILQQVVDSGRVVEAIDIIETAVESVFKDSELVFQLNEAADQFVVEVREKGSDKVVRQFPPEEVIELAEFMESQSPMTFSEGYLKGLLFDRVI